MALTRLVVVQAPEALRATENYEARIFVASDLALRREAFVSARLGAQAIDGCRVDSLGASLTGYIREMPQEGDELSVAIDSAELVPTGLTYQESDDGPVIV